MFCLAISFCTHILIFFVDIDECESEPCLAGGTCDDLINAFHCTCPRGRDGTRCESGTVVSVCTDCIDIVLLLY